MEWGEQAHETALRELKEETGLVATTGPLLGAQSEWFEAGDLGQRGHALRLTFEAHDCSGTLPLARRFKRMPVCNSTPSNGQESVMPSNCGIRHRPTH